MTTQNARIEPLAVWSLVLSLLGFFCLGPLGTIPAVICGHVARTRLRNPTLADAGGGLALAGLIIGYIGLAAFVLIATVWLMLGHPLQLLSRQQPPPNVPGEVAPDLPAVHRLTLEYQSEGQAQSKFSFVEERDLRYRGYGSGEFDLQLYYDSNDSAFGALLGYEDDMRLFYPLGKMNWDEINLLSSIPSVEPVNVVGPLNTNREGTAFLLRTRSGKYVALRLLKIHAVTYSDIEKGRIGHVEIEWRMF